MILKLLNRVTIYIYVELDSHKTWREHSLEMLITTDLDDNTHIRAVHDLVVPIVGPFK